MKPIFSKLLPKGSVLVFSLIILSLMLVASLTILSSAVLQQKAALSTGNSTRSFQVADSGIEQVLYQIYQGSNATLGDIAQRTTGDSSHCSNGVITSDDGWSVVFYEGTDGTTRMTSCADTDWRDRVTKIKSQGSKSGTTRAVEVAVAAASSGFESGMIVMWSGDVADIPTGWALCDGTNGTPDLSGRFVVGVGTLDDQSYSLGDTGGSADAVLVAHSHAYNRQASSGSGPAGGLEDEENQSRLNSYSTSVEGESGEGKNIPPYYALAYIIKY